MSTHITYLCRKGYEFYAAIDRETLIDMLDHVLSDLVNTNSMRERQFKFIKIVYFLSVNKQYLNGDNEKNIVESTKRKILEMNNRTSYIGGLHCLASSYQRLFGEQMP